MYNHVDSGNVGNIIKSLSKTKNSKWFLETNYCYSSDGNLMWFDIIIEVWW